MAEQAKFRDLIDAFRKNEATQIIIIDTVYDEQYEVAGFSSAPD